MHDRVVTIHAEVRPIQDSESREHHHQKTPLCQQLKADFDV